MERFIIAGDCAIRISDIAPVGDDSRTDPQTIVLLHGYLENLNIWDEMTPFLSGGGVRVVAPDLPGHGISQICGPVHSMEFLADVIYKALIELNVAKCCVVGHSMGGYVALALAARHPEILSGLVLFSSTPNADSPEKQADRLREIALVEGGKKELLARSAPGRGFAPENRRRFADEIEDLAELVMLTEDEGITALLRGMAARSDQNDMLSHLPVPQMFILGRHDEYISPDIANAMISRHPSARVVWLEHSGHNGLIEEPRPAAEALLEMIHNN